MIYNLSKKYHSILNTIETEIGIKHVKDCFENELSNALHLLRVSAPIVVKSNSGLNDDLNGIERPVKFDLLASGDEVVIVHSLAKWKRMALKKYKLINFDGLYADMNAIRRDEELDHIHSIYVDQWDWEQIIKEDNRNLDYLINIVKKIYAAILKTQENILKKFPNLLGYFNEKIHFITSAELLKLYPDLSAKERENAIAKKYGSVFIMQIGDKLANGLPHDGRAPDYDDWQLNGDILIWYPLLNHAIEISSMGIRVDAKSLYIQLEKSNTLERLKLPYHQDLINNQLPLTIGGGIGQSRLCLILLNKVHIGEVQASIWSEEEIENLKKQGIELL